MPSVFYYYISMRAFIYIIGVIGLKTVSKAAFTVFICVAAIGAVLYGEAVNRSIINAAERCIKIVIPSLFLFMSAAGALASTGALDIISKPFDLLFGKILALPKGASALFLISNLAGYPVGMAMLSKLCEKGRIDKRSAEAMSIYSFAAGPAFVINAVGVGIFHDRKLGLILLCSTFCTNIVLAAVINRIYKPRIRPADNTCPDNLSEVFVGSVTSAGEALLKMSMMIILFSALLAVGDKIGIFSYLRDFFPLSRNGEILIRAAIEITELSALSGTALAAAPAACAVLSFGGICVLLQIKASVGKTLCIKQMIIWLPVRSALSILISKLMIFLFMDNSIPTIAYNDEIIVELDNFIPSICLIMMIFLLVLQKRLDFFKRI